MGTVGPDRTRMNDVADLFNENFADVWRFVRRRTMSSADADEVTAETFATACRRSADLPPGPERRLWLFGVARYVLANHRRTLARRHRLSARRTQSATAGATGESAIAVALHPRRCSRALAS
jgi:DNA-directed RNA polymerase specialized sigma24 family protein